MKTPKVVTPVNEDQATVTARIAARRVPNAVRAIRLVGNLGVHKLTPEQVEQIRSTLDREIKETMMRLHDGGHVSFQLISSPPLKEKK